MERETKNQETITKVPEVKLDFWDNVQNWAVSVLIFVAWIKIFNFYNLFTFGESLIAMILAGFGIVWWVKSGTFTKLMDYNSQLIDFEQTLEHNKKRPLRLVLSGALGLILIFAPLVLLFVAMVTLNLHFIWLAVLVETTIIVMETIYKIGYKRGKDGKRKQGKQ